MYVFPELGVSLSVGLCDIFAILSEGCRPKVVAKSSGAKKNFGGCITRDAGWQSFEIALTFGE